MIDSRKPMSPADRALWLRSVAEAIPSQIVTKFEAGQVQHHGDLGEVPVNKLVEEMEAEALDQLAYVAELKRRLPLYADEVTRDMLFLKQYITSIDTTGLAPSEDRPKVFEIFAKYV